jgi:serine protease AprX
VVKIIGKSIDGLRPVRTAVQTDPQASWADQLTSEIAVERVRAKAVWGRRVQLAGGRPETTGGTIRHVGLMLGVAILASSGVASAQTTRFDEMVEKALEQGRSLPVVAQYKDEAAKERLEKLLKTSNAKKVRTHLAMKGVSAEPRSAEFKTLAASRDVAYLSYDAPVHSTQFGMTPDWEQILVETDATPTAPDAGGTTLGMNPSAPMGDGGGLFIDGGGLVIKPIGSVLPISPIDASGAAAARSRYGVTGSGVTVAIIDSGVQTSVDLPASRIRAFIDFVGGKTTPYDDYGHGTHVAGIIAGNGSRSYGRYTGVAPAVSIVALKVLDGRGSGTTSNVLAALDWVLAHYKRYNIRVVNLSLGHPVYAPIAQDPLVQAVEALSKKGVVVVAASGNFGKLQTAQKVYASVTSPGNAPSAVTVGAVHTNGTLKRSDDYVTDFSGRGPTRFEEAMKPDLVAPGYAVVSTAAAGSYLLTTYPTTRVMTGYMRLNGTSMATPVVAGTAALMLGANPSLSAHTVKAVLQYTAERMGTTDAMTQGAGELNVAGAVRLAKLINTAAAPNTRWVKGSSRPTRADLLFGEIAYWGRATIWHNTMHVGQDVYMNLAQWKDNITWGFADNIVWSFADNIVWSFADNIVWSFADDKLVWGFTDDNIVWSFADENIVWSFTNENIVWSFADNIVWSFADNIVWGFDDHIVWGFNTNNIVWGFDDHIVWGFDTSVVRGFSILVGDDQ